MKIRLQLHLISAVLSQILFTKQSSDKQKTGKSTSFYIITKTINDK